MFEDAIEVQRVGLWTELPRRHPSVGIFGSEHGFARVDERFQLIAPSLIETILGERPVKVRQQLSHLIRIVFQPDR